MRQVINRHSPKLKMALRVLGIAAVTGCVIGATFLIFLRPPSFLRIQEVAVMTPLKHISEYDLVRLSGVKKGDNIVRLKLAKVRENLQRYPWIKEIRLSKRVPARLLVWVEEQEPIALLEMVEPEGGTGWYLVNPEGKVFKKAESNDPKDLPILTGLAPEEISTRLPPLVAFLKSIEESEAIASLGVSEIHWSDPAGLSLFTKEPCIRLDLGRVEKGADEAVAFWEERLKRFSDAWGMIQSTAKKPKVVDLSLERRIVVKQQF